MQVTPAAATTAPASSGAGTAQSQSATIDYDRYLQLLIAQLKNQDPTNPTDSTQFVSQLASFSSVEQQVNTNAKLDSLLTASALSEASAAIGRTLTSPDGSVSGQVKSVNIVSGSAQATLTDGRTIALGSGVTIS